MDWFVLEEQLPVMIAKKRTVKGVYYHDMWFWPQKESLPYLPCAYCISEIADCVSQMNEWLFTHYPKEARAECYFTQAHHAIELKSWDLNEYIY